MPNQIIQDLQDLVDFLKAHPDLPMPTSVNIIVGEFREENLDTAKVIAKVLGTFKKDMDNSFLRLVKYFGRVSIRYVFYRSAVCTKRVVGIKTETIMVPAPGAEMIEKTKEVELVEWDCPSLLDGDQ